MLGCQCVGSSSRSQILLGSKFNNSKLPGLSCFIRSCHPFMIGESATAGYPSEEKGLETDGNGVKACDACYS